MRPSSPPSEPCQCDPLPFISASLKRVLALRRWLTKPVSPSLEPRYRVAALLPGSELVLIVVSQLVALFTEALVFGAFTVLYAIAIWILLYREKKRNQSSLNKRLFVTSTIMWLLAVTVCPVIFSSQVFKRDFDSS